MNMAFQEPRCAINIGMGQDNGFTEVPEAMFIRDMAAGFMSDGIFMPGMFIPGIFIPGMLVSWAAAVASRRTNGSVFTEAPIGFGNRSLWSRLCRGHARNG
jgi:hypothetical protein